MEVVHSSVRPKPRQPSDAKRLTACARFQIVKPLNETWQDVGDRLWDLHDIIHRVLNTAVSALHGERDPDRDVETMLDEYREYWKKQAHPRRGALSINTTALSAPMQAARSAYQTWRKRSALGEKSLPSFRAGYPIGLHQSVWQLNKEGRDYILAAQLWTNAEKKPRTRLLLRALGPSGYAVLRACVEGTYEIRSCSILRNKRRKAWEVLISYSFAPREVIQGEHTVAVHRGRFAFLTVACTDGDARTLIDGGAIKAFKMQMRGRRASFGRHMRHLGRSAKGHGWSRRKRAVLDLDRKEANFVKTAVQQAASALIQYCTRRGAKEILIEDYSTVHEDDDARRFLPSWPWAMLKQAIEWAAEKVSLPVRAVPAAYISQRCPHCGVASEENVNLTAHQLKCSACGFGPRNVDYVACWNMLAAGGLGDEAAKKFEKALGRFILSARGDVSSKPPGPLAGDNVSKSETKGPSTSKGGGEGAMK